MDLRWTTASPLFSGWENNGVDLLEVSGGNYEIPAMDMGKRGEAPVVKESTQIREAFFIDYAAELREHSDIPNDGHRRVSAPTPRWPRRWRSTRPT